LTEYVDIYYSGPITQDGKTLDVPTLLAFKRAKKEEASSIILGWVEGGMRRGRVWRISGFYTKPSR